MTSAIGDFGLGDGAARSALRTGVAHRLELPLRHVRPYPTVAELNPFLDRFAKWIEALLALLWCDLGQLTSVTRTHVACDRVVIAADQCRRVPKAVRQIVSSQDLHDLLGLLHGSSSVHISEAEDHPPPGRALQPS